MAASRPWSPFNEVARLLQSGRIIEGRLGPPWAFSADYPVVRDVRLRGRLGPTQRAMCGHVDVPNITLVYDLQFGTRSQSQHGSDPASGKFHTVRRTECQSRRS
jgi:hypothetical protein